MHAVYYGFTSPHFSNLNIKNLRDYGVLYEWVLFPSARELLGFNNEHLVFDVSLLIYFDMLTIKYYVCTPSPPCSTGFVVITWFVTRPFNVIVLKKLTPDVPIPFLFYVWLHNLFSVVPCLLSGIIIIKLWNSSDRFKWFHFSLEILENVFLNWNWMDLSHIVQVLYGSWLEISVEE